MFNKMKSELSSIKTAYYKSIIKIFAIFIVFSILIPNCICQWVQVSNGISNRSIYSLASSGNNIFAGTWANHGVYLSTNNGTNWTQTSLNNQTVYALAVNGNYIFAGTHLQGVYLSTNDGASWIQTSLSHPRVYSIVIGGNNIFAGTYDTGTANGVYLSTNNGTSWTKMSLNEITYSLAVNGNNIFAGSSFFRGIYLSTNNGSNWTQVFQDTVNINALAVNGNNIYAGTALIGINIGLGVFKSTNNGSTWIQTGLNNVVVYSLAVYGNSVFAGTSDSGVYISNDNGINWTRRNEGLYNPPTINSFCILNNYIFAGTGGFGVYRRPLSELVGIQPISSEIPEEFSLSQNYPNPFNPETKIKFEIPISKSETNSKTEIRIYDISGKLIETLVKENLSPGTYEVTWSAANYSSGVYFYKLVSGNYVNTKKMILIK
jgi:hypothetical protein